uniref:hypothetical protein n=1 Tax=Agathobacter sp. TaxID=2021311 RepID=UPI004056D791
MFHAVYICFDGDNGLVSWPFSGNLTERFKKGDTLSLLFSVVEEYQDDNIIFENLDYFAEGAEALQNSTYLSIDSYLPK